MVEAALDAAAGARVVDVGTGSGAIALALKRRAARPRVVGHRRQRRRARRRARQRGAARPRGRVRAQGDLLDRRSGPIDAVVSNPPYVARRRDRLPPEIARHEPRVALFGGADGLDVIPAAGAGRAPACRSSRSRSARRQADGGGGAAASGLVRRRGACATWPGIERRGRSGGALTFEALHRRPAAWRCSRPTPSTGSRATPRTPTAVERLYALKGRAPDKPARGDVLRRRARARGAARARAAHAGAARAAAARRRDAAAAEPARPLPARAAARARSACACPTLPRSRGARRVRCCRAPPTSPAGPTRGASRTSRRRSARGADLVLDGGELAGTPSTVVDLRALRGGAGAWRIVPRTASACRRRSR